MKITEVVLTKSLKRTVASKNELGLTNYNSIEPSISITLSEPTEEEIKQTWERINWELNDQLDTEPGWMKHDGIADNKEVDTK